MALGLATISVGLGVLALIFAILAFIVAVVACLKITFVQKQAPEKIPHAGYEEAQYRAEAMQRALEPQEDIFDDEDFITEFPGRYI